MLKFQDIHSGRFYNEDTFEAMADIPDGVIDMLLVDLPYGTTACKWDTVLPFDKLWSEYNRVCKENAAMVFTASQPFASALIASNINNYAYDWYWVKSRSTGFTNAKKQPLRNVEHIHVFYRKPALYNPQGLLRINKIVKNGKSVGGDTLRGDIKDSAGKGSLRTEGKEYVQEWTNYPKQTLEVAHDSTKRIHPTQKPVALFEYLIRTYTNKDDLVLDNTAGSGTTAIAAINSGRRWVCIEQDETYANAAIERIKSHVVTESELHNDTTT